MIVELLAADAILLPSILAALRALAGDNERDARDLLAELLPAVAEPLVAETNGVLRSVLTRGLSRVQWSVVADEMADRWTRTHSRDFLRAAADGMKVTPVRRKMSRAG